MYLLDTNIVIEYFAGNTDLTEKVKNSVGSLYISAITLGELYIGINRVVNREKHRSMLNDFLEWCSILSIDNMTAPLFGEITASLFKKGKPIPSNDVWIAAHARQHGLTLVSRDNHFTEIEGIILEAW